MRSQELVHMHMITAETIRAIRGVHEILIIACSLIKYSKGSLDTSGFASLSSHACF